jgi:hypothetical protein
MKRPMLVIVLMLALLGNSVSGANAQSKLAAPADSLVTKADSTAARPDTTAMAPTAAPAVAPPATTAPSAAPTTTAATPATAPASRNSKRNDKIYYGGTVTLGFGTNTSIGVFPMIGYKLTPKISGGVEAGYQHVSYSNNHSTESYGGSLFARYRVGRALFAHGEYQSYNYEIFHTANSSSREWVPALLLGGGIVKPISPRTAAYAEVLFDVLQDKNSPYGSWEPVVYLGVSVGF